MVVDRGRVVFTYGDIEELSYLASVRKSILAMLYGYWVNNGAIDLDATMAELGVDDVGGLLPIERRARVEHLITARSGVYHPASNSGDNLADAPERGSQEPGAYMLYSNWDFNAAVGPFQGAYTGRGAIGQWITVLPALDLVIAHKTNSVYRRTTSWDSWHRMLELLLEARGAEMPGPYPWR